MGKILEALLTEQLRVDSGTEQRTPEHRALCEKSGTLQDALAETLTTTKELLEDWLKRFLMKAVATTGKI